ncbi:MogA/MoaB family molybdenum cofactor biosynthesis protein [Alkalicoccobacillus porphyridii]|uniref:Molybdenum cofactor biosynthesis protein B n=1 Tax=Alkalicoccobacillus porphyridii TaxID=2597270 RepID=A0A553ZVL7_9BACI|nr:MogA/MoaB family molybdenum cofactor biosynthesis protein [Alkalicoccobacillus porphyridii]TSB45356.1 MogA/MoaB family molybdenum cofactor biosynthesis protein [Alkalicoccobacillus porphyridii]
MSHPAHTQSAKCKVITVSDTRTQETDKSGALIKTLLEQSSHEITEYEIVKDDAMAIQSAISSALNQENIEVILLTGGTGIARRDVTFEVVEKVLEKELPGFGEIFRYLSYEYDIGSAAMLSRAIAGTANEKALFSMPGSSGAVKLAMEKLILPELSHIVHELRK